MAKEGIEICSAAALPTDPTGWPYCALLRLRAALYLSLGAIEYESHIDGHGLESTHIAKGIYQQLVADWHDKDDVEELIWCQSNIGNCLTAENRADEAVAILKEVYNENKAVSKIGGAHAYWPLNLGLALKMLGKHEEAKSKLEEAVRATSEFYGDTSAEMAT